MSSFFSTKNTDVGCETPQGLQIFFLLLFVTVGPIWNIYDTAGANIENLSRIVIGCLIHTRIYAGRH